MTDQGYDIYELLGVEPGAPLPEVKQAYRWLQKRCHPDIAGPVGHDMAILLNDAYTTLSDPIQRAAYDLVSVFPVSLLLTDIPCTHCFHEGSKTCGGLHFSPHFSLLLVP